MGETFPYDAIDLPVERLNLDSISVGNRMNYIYEGHDDRYYYNVTPLKITGTIFTSLRDNTINDTSELYRDMNPQEVISHMESNETVYTVVFWVIWILLSGGLVFAFLYFDNKWLD